MQITLIIGLFIVVKKWAHEQEHKQSVKDGYELDVEAMYKDSTKVILNEMDKREYMNNIKKNIYTKKKK